MVLLEYPDWEIVVKTFLMLDKSVPLATNATAVFDMDVDDSLTGNITRDMNLLEAAVVRSRANATHRHMHTIIHTYTLGNR